MKLAIVMLGVFFFISAATGYAEITLSQSGGSLKATGSDKTARLDSATKTANVADSNGGRGDISFDAATGDTDLKSSEKTIGFTYSIAKVYLDAGESAKVGPSEGYGGFRIINTSATGDIIATFPDMSRISMPPAAHISFIKLADGNYYLRVVSGSVLYTDPQGHTQTLTSASPPMLVQGFETASNWRNSRQLLGAESAAPATP